MKICNQMEKTFLELLKVYSVFQIHPVSMTDKQPNILQRKKELNLPDRLSTSLKEVEVGIQQQLEAEIIEECST